MTPGASKVGQRGSAIDRQCKCLLNGNGVDKEKEIRSKKERKRSQFSPTRKVNGNAAWAAVQKEWVKMRTRASQEAVVICQSNRANTEKTLSLHETLGKRRRLTKRGNGPSH